MSKPEQLTNETVIAQLKKLEEWFDDPNSSPAVVIPSFSKRQTAGMVISLVRVYLEDALDLERTLRGQR